jgi:tRNA-modifying protein YgfZ
MAGPDAKSFLQGIITNDIEKLGETTPLYAALLSPQGKYLFDFILYDTGDGILIDCEASRVDELMRRLMMYRLRADVIIENLSHLYSVWAIFDDPKVIADPRHVGLGGRAILKKSNIPEGAKGESEDYEALRLSLGVPDGSRDIEIDKRPILEANFETLNGVSFDKGCFVGQEVTARMQYRGAVKKRLYGVTVEGGAPDPLTRIDADGKNAGHILSGLGDMAMALIRDSYVEGDAPLTCAGKAVSIRQR